MKNITCPNCGGPTLRGAVLSGALPVEYFFEDTRERRTPTGAPKPKPVIERVVSAACPHCGLVSRFLERAIRDESKS